MASTSTPGRCYVLNRVRSRTCAHWAIQHPRWAMKSLTVQSSVNPGATTTSAGRGSRSSISVIQARSSSRSSSSRLPTGRPSLFFRDELEGPVPDDDLVPSPCSLLGERSFHSLATKPPLEERDLVGIVEVGRGHPALDL